MSNLTDTVKREASDHAMRMRTPRKGGPGYLARLIMAAVFLAAGLFLVVALTLAKEWSWITAIPTCVCLCGPFVILFSESFVEVLKALPLPWRRNGR